MPDDTAPRPVAPLDVSGLFPELGERLIELLRSLAAADWERPTLCPAWRVRDLAAHLLDTACRRVAIQRDGQAPVAPDRPLDGYTDLVAFLDRLNADWVRAARRLSPRLLVELLERVEPELAAVVSGLDPRAPALFPVSWAGEETSRNWFDVARELTERWLHQQQIRRAVGAPPLSDPRFVDPVLETFARALPHRYREVEAPPGATLAIVVTGERRYQLALRRRVNGWHLLRGAAERPAARIELDEELAWRVFSKGVSPAVARRQARLAGDRRLAEPFFETVAVMA